MLAIHYLGVTPKPSDNQNVLVNQSAALREYWLDQLKASVNGAGETRISHLHGQDH